MPFRLDASVLAYLDIDRRLRNRPGTRTAVAYGASRRSQQHARRNAARNQGSRGTVPRRGVRRRRRGRRAFDVLGRRARDERLRPRHTRRATTNANHRARAGRAATTRSGCSASRSAGYGSLLYAGALPANIPGVVLLAPYLGGRRLPRTIAAAGGLAIWPAASAPASVPPRLAGRSRRSPKVQYNDPARFRGGDPLAETYMPLLEALPRSQIYTADGGSRMDHSGPLCRRSKTTIDAARACPIERGRYDPRMTKQKDRTRPIRPWSPVAAFARHFGSCNGTSRRLADPHRETGRFCRRRQSRRGSRQRRRCTAITASSNIRSAPARARRIS